MLSFVCEPRSLVYSPIHIVTAFGRVIPHFSVAKLVCSRVRLKALVNGVTSQLFLYRAGGFANASVARFSLAVSRQEKSGEETKRVSAFINVEAWRNNANTESLGQIT